MTRGSRIRQIGWLVALAICLACFVALTFRVNTVKSQVRLAERQIVALESDKLLLETEFETRANQQQLADWNAIEFGYQAPRADQYVEGERQLASLGVPYGRGAPSPIRVARAPQTQDFAGDTAMVSPVSGRQVAKANANTAAGVVDAVRDNGSSYSESDFARAFSEASPIVARVAEVVE